MFYTHIDYKRYVIGNLLMRWGSTEYLKYNLAAGLPVFIFFVIALPVIY